MTAVVDSKSLQDGWYVDREIYTSERIFELEKKLIFHKTWHFACFIHDVKAAGDYFTLTVADQPVMVVRGTDGELRAFFNACTHRGAALNNDRAGNCGRRFTCMYHAWSFNLEGKLIGVPHQEAYGPDFKREDYKLVPVRVETFGDLVFVTVNPDAAPLLDYLGEMAGHLGRYATGIEPIGRNSWIYEGNWKLWHENFRDNYHPQFAHRAINDMTPHYADRGGNWALEPGHSLLRWISEEPNVKQYVRMLNHHSGVNFPEGAKPALAGGDHVFNEAPQEVLAVFPNMDVQPGPWVEGVGERGARAGHIQVVTPLSPNRTRVDYICYSSTDDDAVTRQVMLEGLANNQGSWGRISCDDTEAAVRCQVGLRGIGTQFSPFSRGIKPGKGGTDVDPRDEYSLREFYKVYNQYLTKEI